MKENIKVLLVHNINVYKNTHIGGEEIAFFSEVDALEKKLGKDKVFTYIVMNKSLSKFLLFFTIWFNIKHYFKIKSLVKKHNIDIVHVHNFFPLLTPSIFYGAKSAGAKTIQTLHNYRKYCLNGVFFYMGGSCTNCPAKSYWHGIKKRCFRNSTFQSLFMTMVNRFYSLINYEKKIDAYFVLSNIQKNLILEFDKTNTLEKKTFLKPNFIKEFDYKVDSKDKKDYIYVGRLEYQKGVQFLLDFWKMLPRNFVLNIIGQGELQSEIDEDRWPHIKYLGRVEHNDTLKLIAKSKYLIQPSLMYETFSLTTIEALSLGTPVIAFAYGTRKEFIKNGKNGFLVTLENFNNIVKKSKSIVGKEYEKMSDEAKKFASSYTQKNIIDKQIKLYNTIK